MRFRPSPSSTIPGLCIPSLSPLGHSYGFLGKFGFQVSSVFMACTNLNSLSQVSPTRSPLVNQETNWPENSRMRETILMQDSSECMELATELDSMMTLSRLLGKVRQKVLSRLNPASWEFGFLRFLLYYTADLGVHALVWFGFEGGKEWIQRSQDLIATLNTNPKAPFVTRAVQFGSEPLFDQAVSVTSLKNRIASMQRNLTSLQIPVSSVFCPKLAEYRPDPVSPPFYLYFDQVTISELAYGWVVASRL